MSGNDLEGHISSPKYVTPYLEGSKLYMSTSLLLTTYDGFLRSLILPRYMSDHTDRDDNKHHVNSFHYIQCTSYHFL